MKKLLFLLLLLTFPAMVFPQIMIEEESEEELVDVGSIKTGVKSKAKAMLYSFVIPGMGEKYVDEHGKASFHFLSETFLLGALYVCYAYGDKYYQDARTYASLHAGAKESGKDLYYYENLALFSSIWEHNEIYKLNRQEEEQYPENSDWTWSWDTRESQLTYKDTMRKYRTMKRAGNLIIGGMVLHRMVSAIDAVRGAKNYKVKTTSIHTDGEKIFLTYRF